MKKAIVINGSGKTGKDAFVKMATEFFAEHGIVVHNISSVTKVKEAALLLGWNGEKDESGRMFLSELKDLSTDFYDGPLRYMRDLYDKGTDGVYFFHIREPEDISAFVKTSGATTLLIAKSDAPQYKNHADAEVEEYEYYDHKVDNNGSIYALGKAMEKFCTPILGNIKADMAAKKSAQFLNGVLRGYDGIVNFRASKIDPYCMISA